MNVNYHNSFVAEIRGHIQHYNPKRYWKLRNFCTSSGGGKLKKILQYIALLYIKRCDAKNNASLGTDLGRGATFGSIPTFPHGIYGIIISPDAVIGKNCRIYHQVTIGNDDRDKLNVPTIGDNVNIYPGAKILGKIKIGNNVRIGANAVVTRDVPDGAFVLAPQPEIKIKE